MKVLSFGRPLVRKLIDNSPWLASWDASDVNEIFDKGELREYEKAELVYKDYETPEILFIATGSIWICLRNTHGIAKFGMMFPTSMIGVSQLLRNALSDSPCYEFYAVEKCVVFAVPTKIFLDRLANKPLLWRTVAEASIFFQRKCMRLALLLYVGTTKERLSTALHHYGQPKGTKSQPSQTRIVSISQEDLAILIQSSRQHVNRALKELESEGLIVLGYKKIEIIKPDELEHVALSRHLGISAS